MSKIKDQIRELELRQKKVDFLNHILRSVEEYEDEEFKEVKPEIFELMSQFVQKTATQIEDTGTVDVNQEDPLSKEDIQVVKSFVEKLRKKEQGKPQTKKPNTEKPQGKSSDKKRMQEEMDSVGTNEKMDFAMTHRHLNGKRAQATNPETDTPVRGELCGADAPYLVLKTDEGPRIYVKPENLKLLGGN